MTIRDGWFDDDSERTTCDKRITAMTEPQGGEGQRAEVASSGTGWRGDHVWHYQHAHQCPCGKGSHDSNWAKDALRDALEAKLAVAEARIRELNAGIVSMDGVLHDRNEALRVANEYNAQQARGWDAQLERLREALRVERERAEKEREAHRREERRQTDEYMATRDEFNASLRIYKERLADGERRVKELSAVVDALVAYASGEVPTTELTAKWRDLLALARLAAPVERKGEE